MRPKRVQTRRSQNDKLFFSLSLTFMAAVAGMLTNILHLLQPYFPIPPLSIRPTPHILHPPSSAWLSDWYSGGVDVGESARSVSSFFRRVIQHISFPPDLCLSLCLFVRPSVCFCFSRPVCMSVCLFASGTPVLQMRPMPNYTLITS